MHMFFGTAKDKNMANIFIPNPFLYFFYLLVKIFRLKLKLSQGFPHLNSSVYLSNKISSFTLEEKDIQVYLSINSYQINKKKLASSFLFPFYLYFFSFVISLLFY